MARLFTIRGTTMFIAKLEHPRFGDFDLSSLRTGIMAGSPCPVEVMKAVQADMHMDEVTICYGMTETSPVSFQTGTDDPVDKRVATVGKIHSQVEVKVVDPDGGRVVARGTPGQLCAWVRLREGQEVTGEELREASVAELGLEATAGTRTA